MIFANRKKAGQCLAKALLKFKAKINTIILSLPRGGVPIGYELALALNLPMDILVVRKIGSPNYPEFALGAIASGNVLVWNEAVKRFIDIHDPQIQAVINTERVELMRRELCYRGNKPYPKLQDKIVILVDDGVATGTTVRAAIQALHRLDVASIILAVPVAAKDSIADLESQVDELICLYQPENFNAVGAWYTDFAQVSDAEVIEIMKKLT
jgi:putative phosphoribosyl transferase